MTSTLDAPATSAMLSNVTPVTETLALTERDNIMADIQVTIEDFVAPEREPHKYAPIIAQLIEAGPDKVATVEFATDAEARRFVSEFQAAAREAGFSGVKRAYTETDGVFRVSMAVRDKITRVRKSKNDEGAPKGKAKGE